jgi:ABC-type uncharacterized transport system permease subunit
VIADKEGDPVLFSAAGRRVKGQTRALMSGDFIPLQFFPDDDPIGLLTPKPAAIGRLV